MNEHAEPRRDVSEEEKKVMDDKPKIVRRISIIVYNNGKVEVPNPPDDMIFTIHILNIVERMVLDNYREKLQEKIESGEIKIPT